MDQSPVVAPGGYQALFRRRNEVFYPYRRIGIVARRPALWAHVSGNGTDVELSPNDWVRELTQRILDQGTTDGAEYLGYPVVLFTITGAKSGKKRYVPLMRVEVDGKYAMVGSNGAGPTNPSWYYNVKANPAVTVQDGETVVTLNARELNGAERAQWWKLAVEAYPLYAEYQTQTDRQLPVFVLE